MSVLSAIILAIGMVLFGAAIDNGLNNIARSINYFADKYKEAK